MGRVGAHCNRLLFLLYRSLTCCSCARCCPAQLLLLLPLLLLPLLPLLLLPPLLLPLLLLPLLLLLRHSWVPGRHHGRRQCPPNPFRGLRGLLLRQCRGCEQAQTHISAASDSVTDTIQSCV